MVATIRRLTAGSSHNQPVTSMPAPAMATPSDTPASAALSGSAPSTLSGLWRSAMKSHAVPPLMSSRATATQTIRVALAGIPITGGAAWHFMADRKSDLKVRGAYLHMAADAGVTLG